MLGPNFSVTCFPRLTGTQCPFYCTLGHVTGDGVYGGQAWWPWSPPEGVINSGGSWEIPQPPTHFQRRGCPQQHSPLSRCTRVTSGGCPRPCRVPGLLSVDSPAVRCKAQVLGEAQLKEKLPGAGRRGRDLARRGQHGRHKPHSQSAPSHQDGLLLRCRVLSPCPGWG